MAPLEPPASPALCIQENVKCHMNKVDLDES